MYFMCPLHFCCFTSVTTCYHVTLSTLPSSFPPVREGSTALFIRAGQTAAGDQFRETLRRRWRRRCPGEAPQRRKPLRWIHGFLFGLSAAETEQTHGLELKLVVFFFFLQRHKLCQSLESVEAAVESVGPSPEKLCLSPCGLVESVSEMSEPQKSENIPDEAAGKGKEIPNGGNPAKTKSPLSDHFKYTSTESDNSDFDLAAIYVSDAQYNRNIFFDTSPQSVRLYLLYNRWFLKVLLYFFILVNLSLAATMLVELLCLLVFTCRLVHYAKVIPRDNSAERSGASGTPCLRSSMSSCSSCSASSSSLSCAEAARQTVRRPGLKTINGAPYFTNYLEIVFDLYVLVTTANSPDVM
ncbi:hypothetical protein INR49_004759, partial [Caranx melampygus]